MIKCECVKNIEAESVEEAENQVINDLTLGMLETIQNQTLALDMNRTQGVETGASLIEKEKLELPGDN